MLEILIGILLLFVVLGAFWIGARMAQLSRIQQEFPQSIAQMLEEKHRLMLADLHEGLTRQGDRINQVLGDTSDKQRNVISTELKLTRDNMHQLQLAQSERLGELREMMAKQLAELSAAMQERLNAMREEILAKQMQTLTDQGRADQELIQTTMANATLQLKSAMEALTQTTDTRL